MRARPVACETCACWTWWWWGIPKCGRRWPSVMRFTPIPKPPRTTTWKPPNWKPSSPEYGTATPRKRVPPNCWAAWAFRRFAQCEMAEVAGFKLRVLLAQALFLKPDVLSWTDRPITDINTIRWLGEACWTNTTPTMIIISHDRRLNEVCTHSGFGLQHHHHLSERFYDDYMLASAQSREASALNVQAKKNCKIAEFVARFRRQQIQSPSGNQSSQKQADKIKSEMVEVKPSTVKTAYRFWSRWKSQAAPSGCGVEKAAETLWNSCLKTWTSSAKRTTPRHHRPERRGQNPPCWNSW